ncbi:MAG: phosphate ABC transporter permease subunit PstC [Dethiobacter sp.]|nr:phosphate ABC transporter permease subunit PstC [Dethiobacter sp.]MBS3900769.1 phosphate ABC transporter permease subunit PstC [Dethiobacter sp.]MBS3988804.1 phosphate ABC transporter permease subunit PstC [Dethiobacter sp.]
MAATKQTTRPQNGEGVFPYLTAAAAALILLLTGSILLVVLWGAWPAWQAFGPAFLATSVWDPVQNLYGAIPAVFGTLVTSLIALALAGPLGIGTAIFLSELAPPWLKKPASFTVELLAAVPSVVFGLWGLFVLAPWFRVGPGQFLETNLGFLPLFQGPSLGIGVLTAGLVLAMMILPTITAISREVIRAVPQELREAMFALGSTRWEMIAKVVLPTGKVGITGALLLGLGRSFGEAIAVTMVIGNANLIPSSLLAPAQTIASLIVNEFPEAFDLQLSALLLLGLLLFIITLAVNMIAVWLVQRTTQGIPSSQEKRPVKRRTLRRFFSNGQ